MIGHGYSPGYTQDKCSFRTTVQRDLWLATKDEQREVIRWVGRLHYARSYFEVISALGRLPCSPSGWIISPYEDVAKEAGLSKAIVVLALDRLMEAGVVKREMRSAYRMTKDNHRRLAETSAWRICISGMGEKAGESLSKPMYWRKPRTKA